MTAGVPTPHDGRGAGDPVGPVASLEAIEVHRSDHRIRCTVGIRAGDRQVTGAATEPDSPGGAARAAARAALEAAESLDATYRFGLEGVRPMDLFGEAGVVLVVDAVSGRDRSRLAGAALIERSIEEAAARAALDALRNWRP